MPESNHAILDIILEEVRSLRADFQKSTLQTAERLATVEAGLKPLLPNGRPGKIAELEESVQKLQNWRWYVLGICAATSVCVPVALHFIGIHLAMLFVL